MEYLGRGVAAVNQGEGKVFLSWRLLGTDPDGTGFNVYRATDKAQPVKLNSIPIVNATCYQDSGVDLTKDNAYFVRPVTNGIEGEISLHYRKRHRRSGRRSEQNHRPYRLLAGSPAR